MPNSVDKKQSKRIDWYFAPAFLSFWFVLFFAVVVPIFLKLPEGLTVENEEQHKGEFIAQRAERILYDFEMIGPKVTGSYANENLTVQLLLDELEKIRTVMQHDLFDMEVDVQVVSGAYLRSTMVSMYRNLQNVVVKLSCKNSTSENYLLINSHFDSKHGSPGSGDDGAMVVIMLEILRVISTNRDAYRHPIVFLFNGAEEDGLQASNGFITQHKWAKNCKALINLDSAGSGHREMLFQSGPNHPWLMKYYDNHAKRHYASTVAEELFQSNLIPSDTDFRIFRDYGHVPGLDFAHFYNGYVYHTKFDKSDVIPRGTLQATGNNILSLAKALANATEMENTAKYSEGHVVFYDVLGLFFIYYTETQGKIINTSISLIVIITVAVSLWLIAATRYISIAQVTKIYVITLLLHLAGLMLAIALPLVVAVIFDNDHSMTWFTNKWLVFGLYVCPSLFGLALPNVLYLSFTRNNKLGTHFRIQLIQHGHACILALLCIAGTFKGLRSSYILAISLLFYGLALILNLMTTLYRHGSLWCILIILGQIFPFLYLTYIFLITLSAVTPMLGRFGPNTNPDLLMGTLCALGTILTMGFVMPMWNMFRHSKTLLFSLLLIAITFALLAITPIGFPFRPKTNVGRVHYMNVRRVFYEYDGSISRNESGYFFDSQNRRLIYPKHGNAPMNLQTLEDDCKNYMMCGLPLFTSFMTKNGLWLPTIETAELPDTPKLTLLKKTFNSTNSTARFEFELSGPPNMGIFILPLEGVTLFDWSFMKHLLEKLKKNKEPYFIFAKSGKLSAPLKFSFDFQLNNSTADRPLFELGISAHYISTEYPRGNNAQKFKKEFPDYIYVMEWASSYERYIF